MEKAYFGQSYSWVFPIEGNKDVRVNSEAQMKIARDVTEAVEQYFSKTERQAEEN